MRVCDEVRDPCMAKRIWLCPSHLQHNFGSEAAAVAIHAGHHGSDAGLCACKAHGVRHIRSCMSNTHHTCYKVRSAFLLMKICHGLLPMPDCHLKGTLWAAATNLGASTATVPMKPQSFAVLGASELLSNVIYCSKRPPSIQETRQTKACPCQL